MLWVEAATELPAGYLLEIRWLRIGFISEKMYTCIFTYRGKKVRLISLRRSRESEVRRYNEDILKNEKEKT